MKYFYPSKLLVLIALLSFVACKNRNMNGAHAGSYTPEEVQKASAAMNDFFERAYNQMLDLSPEMRTSLGDKSKDYDKWDDFSEIAYEKRQALAKALHTEAENLYSEAMDEATKLSYKLFQRDREQEMLLYTYRHYDYPVNQMHGMQAEMPSFLMSKQDISNEEEARCYVERVRGFSKRFDQLIEQLKIREQEGIVLPKFVYPMVITTCENLIQGKPFDISDSDNDVYADFKTKWATLTSKGDYKGKDYLAECEAALKEHYKPAYEKLIAFLKDQATRATADDGVWKFPNGDKFYDAELAQTTTTSLSADDIHNMGLKEVERIQNEMRGIMQTVNFKGDLQAFFKFMRDSKQFYYPQTAAGKENFLKDTRNIIAAMQVKLPEYFNLLPKSKLEVKAVEAYREAAAGRAFYEPGAADGSRAGVYYVNCYDMPSQPRYQMEALAYHEGIPGHHNQITIAQEMQSLPKFRRFMTDYTAYIEGWALYCEQLGKEMGFYKDPYSDFGRLAMELFRACRLVVDTGIHNKHWTRQQAIDYYIQNTPNAPADCERMVNRHIVMPGQATAYKVGMMAILEAREKMRTRLGDKFDIKHFHDVVIGNGALPLDVLEDLTEM